MDLTTSFGSSLSFCDLSLFAFAPDEQPIDSTLIALPGFKQMIPFTGCYNKAIAESKTTCKNQGEYIVDSIINRISGVNKSFLHHWVKVKECLQANVRSNLTVAQMLNHLKENDLFAPKFISGSMPANDAKKVFENKVFGLGEEVEDILVRIDAQIISGGFETQNLIKLLPSIFRSYAIDSYERIMSRADSLYNAVPPDGRSLKRNDLNNILELRFSAIMEMLLMSYYNLLVFDLEMRNISHANSISLLPLMLASIMFLKNDCSLVTPDLTDAARDAIKESIKEELVEIYGDAHGVIGENPVQFGKIDALDDEKLMLLAIGIWCQSQKTSMDMLSQMVCMDVGITYAPGNDEDSLVVALGESQGRLSMRVTCSKITFSALRPTVYRDRIAGIVDEASGPCYIEVSTDPVMKLSSVIIPCYSLATTLDMSDKMKSFRMLVKYLYRIGALGKDHRDYLVRITFQAPIEADTSDVEDLGGEPPLPDTRHVVDMFCLFVRDQAFTNNSLQERGLLSTVSSWLKVSAH